MVLPHPLTGKSRVRPLNGRLKNKIVVQVATDTQDATGDPISSWATYATEYAAIIPVNGREYFTAKQTESENTVKFLVRYSSLMAAMTTKHRILWDSRIFDVESIINVGEGNKEMLIICREST